MLVDDLSDDANALRLIRDHGEQLRYRTDSREWMMWSPGLGVWQQRSLDELMPFALATARSTEEQAATLSATLSNGDGARLRARARRGRDRRSLRAAIALAATDPAMATVADDWDRDPWLLNCSNGTLNLQTGELAPHRATQLLAHRTPHPYLPGADCPRWDRFLREIFVTADGQPDLELIAFVQRSVGYSLTGKTTDHLIWLLLGDGANGKSVFLATLLSLFGDFGVTVGKELLVAQPNPHAPNPGVVDLEGRRLALSTEMDEGLRMSEALVKELTGGDRVTARRLHQNPVSFWPTHHLWLALNYLLHVRGTDHGIWRRLAIVPFLATFDEARQEPDLVRKLGREMAGILAWAVEGCRAWQANGNRVGTCPAVEAATGRYRGETDSLGQFLTDCAIHDPAASVPARDLYRAYREWALEQGYEPCADTTFGKRLRARGYEPARTATQRQWRGLRLMAPGGSHATGGAAVGA